TAYYAFATKEIFDLTNKYGNEIIPKIIKNLSKADNYDGRSVLKSIKNITGEDIEPVLSEYGKSSIDPFARLAVKDFEVGLCINNNDIKYIKSNNIPIIKDGKHGFYINFDFTSVNTKNDIKVQIIYPSNNLACEPIVKTKTIQIDVAGKNILSQLWFNEDVFLEGKHILKVFFNDVLYKDVTINFVPATYNKIANMAIIINE
ncbi:MAG: hypothetical protein SNJ70_10800, partial [Armatimonadota bacterium]